jgi:hypothetical protein
MPHFTKLTTAGAAAAVGLSCFGISGSDRASMLGGAWAQSTPALSTVSAAGITLHSVSVDLPNSDQMFAGGADAEAINNTCLACHSAAMVLNQPALTRSAWQQEVDKMRAQYKAPVAEADVPTIVAWLANHKAAQ